MPADSEKGVEILPIKMLVTDLDRTLLKTDKTISDYTAQMFKRCQDQGIMTVFATARPERATRPFQDKIIPDYVIADNGATINHGDTVIRRLLIPSAAKDALISACLESKAVRLITVEAGDCVYTNYDGPPWGISWNIIYNDFAEAIHADSPKLSVECENVNVLYDMLRLYPELHLYSNSGESWHQITRRDATKANAIGYIAELHGFDRRDVIAFGDDHNDVEMLQACGIGVAVADAIDEAKAAADDVCDTSDHDGVAKWIDENWQRRILA